MELYLVFCLLFALLSASATCNGSVPKFLVHQFPNDTWIENLAVRPDGQILVTVASSPEVYLINPQMSSGQPTLVQEFPGVMGAVGITETVPDVFYTVVGNFSLATFRGIKGSFSLWKIDYSSGAVKVSKAFDIPSATFLDGLTTVNSANGLILAADINAGDVLQINIPKKISVVSVNDPLLKPGSVSPVIGVDGIKLHSGYLYFTNPGQDVIGKVPVNSTGFSTGKASVVVPVGGDDFIFDTAGQIYSTGGSNNLTEVYNNLMSVYNVTMLPGPTACQFGRGTNDQGCLYVTTSGGDSAYASSPVKVGGALYAVDVFRNQSCPQQ